MANEEHVKRLLAGVDEWNAWRENNREIQPDLSRAHLNGADFRGADLSHADFNRADLRDSNLYGANLSGAALVNSGLSGANLRRASLRGADVSYAHLSSADLRLADLGGADLHLSRLSSARLGYADLRSANVRGASLIGADLSDADLSSADLTGAQLRHAFIAGTKLNRTVFTDASLWSTIVATDWSGAVGVSQIQHLGPSLGVLDASAKSSGSLPEAFLRGCGLQDWEIWAAKLHAPDLTSSDIGTILEHVQHLKSQAPIQARPIFVSYSHEDSEFVDGLTAALGARGVRYWRDTDHMVAGPLGTQIDRAITLNQTVLLVLSENSVKSDWVYSEVKKARKLEQQGAVDYALCPITLDDAWKTSGWPDHVQDWLQDTYNILSFFEPDDFDRRFEKLLEGLGVYYAEGAE